MAAAFKPSPRRTSVPGNLTLRVDPKNFERIKRAAKRHGISTSEFVRRAVLFALDQMDGQP